jgi:hypothetical protein
VEPTYRLEPRGTYRMEQVEPEGGAEWNLQTLRVEPIEVKTSAVEPTEREVEPSSGIY